MKKTITLLLIAKCLTTLCQEPDLKQIIPPSPEATSLAKFTEVPVSHYTGLPQISIPFFNLNLDGLNIPIGMSYHARGIAVEEVASRVGIGWTLNAGGAVVRQTRGKPDDSHNGYLQHDFYHTFLLIMISVMRCIMMNSRILQIVILISSRSIF